MRFENFKSGVEFMFVKPRKGESSIFWQKTSDDTAQVAGIRATKDYEPPGNWEKYLSEVRHIPPATKVRALTSVRENVR